MMTSRLIAVSMGSLAFGQTNFGGAGSSSGSSSGSASSSQEFPLGSLDTDTRYLFLEPFSETSFFTCSGFSLAQVFHSCSGFSRATRL